MEIPLNLTEDRRFAALLSGLERTRRPLRNVARPFALPEKLKNPLTYPVNKTYLGFSGVERRRGAQVGDWLIKSGLISGPGVCEICGASKTAYHSENYFDIRSVRAVCRSCHRLIHIRHREPRQWSQLVERYARTGTEWFVATPADPQADFRGYLKRTIGADYDLLTATFHGSPPWIEDQFPEDKLLDINYVPPTKAEAESVKPVAPDLPLFERLDSSYYPGPIKPVARRS